MTLTAEDIESRLKQLRDTRLMLMDTYDRLLVAKELVSEEMAEIRTELERVDRLELEEFKSKIPLKVPEIYPC